MRKRYRTLNARNFWDRLHELFLPNHLDPNATVEGHLFETFGPEREFVIKVWNTEPQRIVTIIHGDSGAWWVSSGFHFVNRVGYLVLKPGITLPEFKDFRY